MAGLQRSVVSFRRQGSSGIVWDDRFITEELNQAAESKPKEDGQEAFKLDLSRHGGKEGPSGGQEGPKSPETATGDRPTPIDLQRSRSTADRPPPIDLQRSRSTADRPPPIDLQRSRSTGGGRGAYRTGRVSPAVEPPSPKLSACGCCSPFGQLRKQPKKGSSNKRAKKKHGKRRSR